MFVTKKHIDRRLILKGLGAAFTLPLLDAMTPAFSNPEKEIKLAYIYFPHGAVMDAWSPKQTGTKFEYSPILKPFEPLHEYCTIVSGLRNKGGESSNPHGIIEETWLTCVSPDERRGESGLSADQIAAKQFNNCPMGSLELCGEPGGSINYRGTQGLPLEGNPRKVYLSMFGEGDNYEDRMVKLENTDSLLDYVMESAKSLQKKLGDSDKALINDYFDTVRDAEKRVKKLEENAKNLTQLPQAPFGTPDDFEELIDIQLEMAAIALQTRQTRIVSMRTIKEASMRVFVNLGVAEAFHPLSHHGNNEDRLAQLIKIQRWNAERTVKFAKRCKDMGMLDDMIILYGSNMSNSDKHNNDPLPSILIGKGGGSIKGGQHLKYPQDTPHSRLVHTMLDRAGVHVEKFADSGGTFNEV
jgi:Protein of unknown function (DUF1552)